MSGGTPLDREGSGMASPVTITQCLNRLNAHCRGERDEAAIAVIAADLQPLLRHFDDRVVMSATDTFIIASDWFPSTSEFINEVQHEARIVTRERAALTTGEPPMHEAVPDARVAVRGIRAALALGLPPASTWAEIEARAQLDLEGLAEVETSAQALLASIARGGTDPRGHNHRNGAAGCTICSRHDHSQPDWRESCPACGGPLPDAYTWSTCPVCDGSGWACEERHGFGPVRPCSVCNANAYRLWSGGHYEPGHRCEECVPTRRRREAPNRDDA